MEAIRLSPSFKDLYVIIMDVFNSWLHNLQDFAEILVMPFHEVVELPLDALPGGIITDAVVSSTSAILGFLTGGLTDLPFYQVILGESIFFICSFFVVKGILDIVL